MIHVTCRLTAKNRDQLRDPTLGNRVGYGLPLPNCPLLMADMADIEDSMFIPGIIWGGIPPPQKKTYNNPPLTAAKFVL